jgi:hypothetical protein
MTWGSSCAISSRRYDVDTTSLHACVRGLCGVRAGGPRSKKGVNITQPLARGTWSPVFYLRAITRLTLAPPSVH